MKFCISWHLLDNADKMFHLLLFFSLAINLVYYGLSLTLFNCFLLALCELPVCCLLFAAEELPENASLGVLCDNPLPLINLHFCCATEFCFCIFGPTCTPQTLTNAHIHIDFYILCMVTVKSMDHQQPVIYNLPCSFIPVEEAEVKVKDAPMKNQVEAPP